MEQQKDYIADTIRREMKRQRLSYRKLEERIDLTYNQIFRVCNNKNYTIESLLKVLEGLGMEIVLKKD